MTRQKRVRKTVSGRGRVQAGGRTFHAAWTYRFVQVYTERGAGWVEEFRDDSEWTLTVPQTEKAGLPGLHMGDQAGVRVGRWGEAPAYFHGSTADDAQLTITLRFGSRPSP
jgi:hypothetical protein